MKDKSPNQLVDEIIELIDRHGFTTEDLSNVTELKCSLNDLIYENQTQKYPEWWEDRSESAGEIGYYGPF